MFFNFNCNRLKMRRKIASKCIFPALISNQKVVPWGFPKAIKPKYLCSIRFDKNELTQIFDIIYDHANFYSLFIQDSCNFVHFLSEPRLNYATTEEQ